MGKKKIKLHIGCGNVYKKGYINIDSYNLTKADLKADAAKLPYKDNSADRIENYHLLEHLDRNERDLALKEWFRVLKPKGKLLIEVPDLVRNMEIFLKFSYQERWEQYRNEFKHGRIQTIYGLGEIKGQLHKTGYDKERLKRLLQDHGFIKIKVFSKKGTTIKGESIIGICEKPAGFIKLKKDRVNEKLPLQNQNKYEDLSKNYFRMSLKKLKTWSVYSLRYIADLIEELKFPKI